MTKKLTNAPDKQIVCEYRVNGVKLFAWQHGGTSGFDFLADFNNSDQIGRSLSSVSPSIIALDGLKPYDFYRYADLRVRKSNDPSTFDLLSHLGNQHTIVANDFVSEFAANELAEYYRSKDQAYLTNGLILGLSGLTLIAGGYWLDRRLHPQKKLTHREIRRKMLILAASSPLALSAGILGFKRLTESNGIQLADDINGCKTNPDNIQGPSGNLGDMVTRTFVVTAKIAAIPGNEFASRGLPEPKDRLAVFGSAHFLGGNLNASQSLTNIRKVTDQLMARDFQFFSDAGFSQDVVSELILEEVINTGSSLLLRIDRESDDTLFLRPIPDETGNIFINDPRIIPPLSGDTKNRIRLLRDYSSTTIVPVIDG